MYIYYLSEIIVIENILIIGHLKIRMKLYSTETFKIKSIRLNPSSDHPINCKVPKIGQVSLKSEFVKKS